MGKPRCTHIDVFSGRTEAENARLRVVSVKLEHRAKMEIRGVTEVSRPRRLGTHRDDLRAILTAAGAVSAAEFFA